MPYYLADTNILILYTRQQELYRQIEKQYNLLLPSPAPFISIVSVAEIQAFAGKRAWGTDLKQRMYDVFDAFTVIPIRSDDLVDAYVEIDIYSHGVGRDMGKNDLWIAATAMVTGATLLTTDLDFDHLHGVYILREWIDPNIPST
jgi:tRNA(fMet)-specific endonuclease VapC